MAIQATERVHGVVVAGVGETPYFKRGQAPAGQLALAVQAVLTAADDAGIDARDIDGYVSYGGDENHGCDLAAALGTTDLRWSSAVWGGGGGGVAGAFAHAAAAIMSRLATTVCVLRAHAESTGGRLGSAASSYYMSAHHRAHGIVSPAQLCALRTRRLIDADGVPAETLRAVARASYHHAARNPRAIGRDTVLDDETYERSRWVAEPYHLFDCSRENDGAAAVLLTSADRKADLRHRPAHLVAVAQSKPTGWGSTLENDVDYTSAGFRSLAGRLWQSTGLAPADVDVTQVYENFTGAAVAALIDHGLCTTETADDVLRFENLIAPDGDLPINTAGGNVAEGFVHGIGLALEAVRQVRGDSPNPVAGAEVSLLIGGPVSPFVSSAIFAPEEL